MLSDVDLMEVQINALFRHDQRGWMLHTNEPGEPDPAPRVFLGRTTDGNLWRFRHDLPHSIKRELDDLLRNEPVPNDLNRQPESFEPLLQLLDTHAPISEISSGPAWRIPDTIKPSNDIVMIGPTEADPLREHFPRLAGELPFQLPCAAIIQDGVAVSVCCSARNTNEAAEAGVYTVEKFRGRGHAAAVVAAWSVAVRESHRIPLYSTSWTNMASQGVARKLGMILYGADLSIT